MRLRNISLLPLITAGATTGTRTRAQQAGKNGLTPAPSPLERFPTRLHIGDSRESCPCEFGLRGTCPSSTSPRAQSKGASPQRRKQGKQKFEMPYADGPNRISPRCPRPIYMGDLRVSMFPAFRNYARCGNDSIQLEIQGIRS